MKTPVNEASIQRMERQRRERLNAVDDLANLKALLVKPVRLIHQQVDLLSSLKDFLNAVRHDALDPLQLLLHRAELL
eukprot:CAMPEP_0184377954 /NCGR_PEP_ID=MMETSP0007-20130409/2687_1 /TAXON_ID=97485 /ORGANISM="Prymnesium parvum, Strain Texoma1" /LENGTH=76 /DNA_ID=CAMNT_0026722037 /DNA_START=253 /DNA_END=478 /DNA_ORIENTATION=-